MNRFDLKTMSTSNDTTIICGCCKGETDAARSAFDSETEELVCLNCRADFVVVKAIMGQPCDGLGQRINIKGCYRGEDAPDNA